MKQCTSKLVSHSTIKIDQVSMVVTHQDKLKLHSLFEVDKLLNYSSIITNIHGPDMSKMQTKLTNLNILLRGKASQNQLIKDSMKY